jgi:sulfate permease, SulP family
VRHSYQPHTMMFLPDAGGRWTPVAVTPGKVTEPGLIVYRFGADLFYANQGRFCSEVRSLIRCAPSRIERFVIDAAAITDLDYSAARALHDLVAELEHEGVCMIFGRVSPYLRADMDRHRITAVVGAERIFPTLHQALEFAGVKAERPPAL